MSSTTVNNSLEEFSVCTLFLEFWSNLVPENARQIGKITEVPACTSWQVLLQSVLDCVLIARVCFVNLPGFLRLMAGKGSTS